MAAMATDEEYFELLSRQYDPDIVKIIKSTESPFEAVNAPVTTEKSDSGNVLIRYCVGNFQGAEMVALLGMISKRGKIIKDDVADIKKWIQMFVDKLRQNAIILTSVNAETKRLLDRVIKQAKSQGVHAKLTKEQEFELMIDGVPEKWENYMITPSNVSLQAVKNAMLGMGGM
jgi:hypothetical protein